MMNRIHFALLLLIWFQQANGQEHSSLLLIDNENPSQPLAGCNVEPLDGVRASKMASQASVAGRAGPLPVTGAVLSQRRRIQQETSERPWIIDTHTHFKGDQQIAAESKTRDRNPRDTLGQVIQPEDYRAVADRNKIQSTVVVEAVEQEHPQFNDWLLEQASSELICGYVARGDLTSADFMENYGRYRESGYLKGYRFRRDELHGYLDDPAARKHLRMLEQDGMVVDLLVDPTHVDDVVRLAEKFPKLRIVINHCFRARLEDGRSSDDWKAAVTACSRYPNVYCKLSSIVNFAGTRPFTESAPADLQTYEPILQHCFDAFGEDRVIFGTNWAVCTHFGDVDDVVRVASEFLQAQGQSALQKGMRDNALRVYGIEKKHLR